MERTVRQVIRSGLRFTSIERNVCADVLREWDAVSDALEQFGVVRVLRGVLGFGVWFIRTWPGIGDRLRTNLLLSVNGD